MVVTVAAANRPAERPQLVLEITQRDDLLGRLVRLELVPVDDHPEAPEPIRRGRLQRLPVLALLQLAVADHHDDAAASAEPSLRPGDTAALGDAHPERARVRLDPGDADVRMAVEPVDATEPQEPLAGDHAEREERRVEPRDVVALRGEEDVAVGVVEADLRDVQLLEEQVRDDVQRAEARSEVAGAGALHGDEAFSRHMSASSASIASRLRGAPRTRSSAAFGISFSASTLADASQLLGSMLRDGAPTAKVHRCRDGVPASLTSGHESEPGAAIQRLSNSRTSANLS